MSVYITGDKHRNFASVELFCKRAKTTKKDTLIVLGDAGINFTGTKDDQIYKQYLESLPITFMFVRGNHEMRPSQIIYQTDYRKEIEIHGFFWVEPEYPSLLFAKDGTFYDYLDEKGALRPIFVCGGAYSIDKQYRLSHKLKWFSDEQLTEVEKQQIMKRLKNTHISASPSMQHEKLFVLTHTCPRSVVPHHALLSGIDKALEDWSMEEFFDEIKNELGEKTFTWYCGHFHVDETNRINDKQSFRFMYNDIEMLR